MTNIPVGELPPADRRRLITLGLLRAFGVTAFLIALYYILPLDRLGDVSLAVSLTAGLVILVVVATYQLRAISRAAYPGIRAIEGLAATTPLFLLLFASIYYVMAVADPGNFNANPLTRTDTLYFTVTVFSTVGFGDIAATSQLARVVVMVQMLLDLLILGLGVRVFLGVVQQARQEHQ